MQHNGDYLPSARPHGQHVVHVASWELGREKEPSDKINLNHFKYEVPVF